MNIYLGDEELQKIEDGFWIDTLNDKPVDARRLFANASANHAVREVIAHLRQAHTIISLYTRLKEVEKLVEEL